MLFKEIIGYEQIKEYWKSLTLKEQIPHGFLLDATDGMPALHLAWAWAQYINCTDKKDGDSCGKCPSCKKTMELVHPDLLWTFPVVGASQDEDPCARFMTQWKEFLHREDPYPMANEWILQLSSSNSQPTIYVKSIEAILDNLSKHIAEDGYRIHIIYQPEKMNEASANKLLKQLEEPPLKTIFLLVSLHPEQLLETIVSRLQRIEFAPMPLEQLYQVAQYYHLSASQEELQQAASYAMGNPGELVQYLKNNKLLQQQEEYAETWLIAILQRNVAQVKETIEDLASESREWPIAVLNLILRYTRDILYHKLTESTNLHNPIINNPSLSNNLRVLLDPMLAGAIYASSESAIKDLRGNVVPRLVLFDLSIQWMQLFSRKIRTVGQ